MVFDFNQFEDDSNLLYVTMSDLIGENLVYQKFQSPGSLQLHNSCLLTDSYCYKTPYNSEKITELEETIRSEKIERVPMEQGFLYSDACNGASSINNQYALAYCSCATWLRGQSNQVDGGLNILEYENSLLQNLDFYFEANRDKRLVPLTLALERNRELLNDTIMYYKNLFQDSNQVFFLRRIPYPARSVER